MGGMSVLSLGVVNSSINTGGALKYGNHNNLKGFSQYASVPLRKWGIWGQRLPQKSIRDLIQA